MVKKLSLIIIICAVAVSLAFSEEGKSAKRDYVLKTEGASTVMGVVKTVIPADLSRINSAIIIRDPDGKETKFELRPSAVIYEGTDGKLLSLKEVKEGDKVQINYLSFEFGIPKATAVKLLPIEQSPAEEKDVK